GHADLLLEDLGHHDPRRADVDEIRRSAERAAGLTRQLLAFSRQQVLQPKVVDLNALVLDMDKLLRRLIGEDVELATVLDPTLGLGMVSGTVKQSGGFIWVYSEPGRGATFKIYLPRVDAPVESAAPPAPVERPPRGSETVLLAEDEPAVRAIARQALERQGYTVLAAPSGADALALAAQHGATIHLLLTDVVMPGMSGRDLADRLTAQRPGIRV